MTKIFHNPRCTKSRETLALLQDKGESVEIVEYLKTPPTKTELLEVIKILGILPIELIRKGEKIYKDEFKGKELTDDEWVDAMVAHPVLIERPIVFKNGKAAIGRPAENILHIL